MDTITPFLADHIRTLYSSGLYHKTDLFLRFITELKAPDNLLKVLNYVVHEDVRPELRIKIFGMAFIFELTDEYHKTLRQAAITEHFNMTEDPKNAPATFTQVKAHADKDLKEKLKFINKEFTTTFTVYDIQSRLHHSL